MKNLSHAVILDDHQLFADAFSLLLEKYQFFNLVQSFNQIGELVDFLMSYGNQEIYIFLDYYLGEENGLSIMSEIKRLNKKAIIIFVTSATSPSILQTILKYRPSGILSKSCSIDMITSCLSAIDSQSIYLDLYIQNFLDVQRSTVTNFTPREIELLKYFADGESITKTAERTFLSPHTIIAHRRKMMAKAHCNSIGQLIKFARDHELI